MRIDLTQRYANADDTPALDKDTGKPITLKELLIQCMLTDINGDRQPIPSADKAKRYAIFVELKKAGEYVDLPAEDIALLKQAVLIFGVLVVGQTYEMLEGGAARNTSKTPPSE